MRRLLAAFRQYILVPLLVLTTVATLLPLVETNVWWIRYLDFPRLQLAAVLAVLIILYALLGGWRGPAGIGLIVVAMAGLGYHATKLYPYAPFAEPMAVTTAAGACPDGATLRVMTANVKAENEGGAAFLDAVREIEPDLLLVLETDDWWDRELRRLPGFAYREQHIPPGPGYYGLHVLSRHPLRNPAMRFYFDSGTPTFRGEIKLPGGQRAMFFGLHPPPPQSWSRPTTLRDGHLAQVALEAREAGVPVIVAGDLNAVPWERIFRRTLRVGQLLDPRVGRGWMPSYRASPGMVWPLDHVLFQESLALMHFDVMDDIGSDHSPVVADLCLDADVVAEQRAPALAEDDLEEFEVALEAARQADAGDGASLPNQP